MKEKKVTLKQWVRALRSGKYKQTQTSLYSFNGYCCLGVACRLAGYSVKDISGVSYPGDVLQITGAPKNGKRLFGMKLPLTINKLGILNDGDGAFIQHTFKQIADILTGKMKPKKEE